MAWQKRFAAFVVMVSLAGCATEITEPPEVTLVDITMKNAALFEQQVGVVLRVRNPNNGPISVDGYRFTLDLNGKPFTKGMSSESFTVPRLGEATTTGDAGISTFDILRQVIAAPDAKNVDYRLIGTLFLAGPGGKKLPFEQTGQIDLPALGGRR